MLARVTRSPYRSRIMKVRLICAVATFAILLAGCATTNTVIFDSTKRAPTTEVDVYKDRKKPTRTYTEIAELSYLGPREEELTALKRFVTQSKSLGGNGLIMWTEYGGVKGGGTLFQSTAWV